jgi:hypothetical protein
MIAVAKLDVMCDGCWAFISVRPSPPAKDGSVNAMEEDLLREEYSRVCAYDIGSHSYQIRHYCKNCYRSPK